MILFEEAISIIEEQAREWRPKTATLPLLQCVGSKIVRNVFSSENVPPANVSAMDGFAVCHNDVQITSGSKRLPIAGIIHAGDNVFPRPAANPHAIEIMTGAILPRFPFDSVVRYEDAKIEVASDGSRYAVFSQSARPYQNVRRLGSDIKFGGRVLEAGDTLTISKVMLCAALGISEIEVYTKPRIAIISTGDEIVDFRTKQISPTQTRNSSAAYLDALCKELGIATEYFGISRDTPKTFALTLARALYENFDAIVTTGAVSVGKKDHLPEAVRYLGGECLFHKVAIRPAKPMFLAKIKGVPVFGMPGNPLATAVGFQFFLLPFFEKALKRREKILAFSKRMYEKPHGLTSFFVGRLYSSEGRLEVDVFDGQNSHMTSSFGRANSWIMNSFQQKIIEENELVSCFPMADFTVENTG